MSVLQKPVNINDCYNRRLFSSFNDCDKGVSFVYTKLETETKNQCTCVKLIPCKETLHPDDDSLFIILGFPSVDTSLPQLSSFTGFPLVYGNHLLPCLKLVTSAKKKKQVICDLHLLMNDITIYFYNGISWNIFPSELSMNTFKSLFS